MATYPDDLEIAALAALHHWHSNSRNFNRKEPGYLALLRRALERREALPYQLSRRGLNNERLVAEALAGAEG